MTHSTNSKNWHQKHLESSSWGARLADKISANMGSWTFIIIQTIFVFIWLSLNLYGYVSHWDPYPFILLNLIFSTQASYAAPIIMMSQNRASERDRAQANEDYETNFEAKKEIEELQSHLSRIEIDKLDRIIELLEKK
ncbi:hypothetical protein BH11PAT3_BH11PAT3_3500 [soil metagenome]